MVENSNEALQAEIGITLNKLTKQLSVAEARMVKTATKMEKRFANTNRAIVGGFNRANRSAQGFANGGMRQLSMQFSQVMQQGAVTGDYARAFSVQLADMALVLGPAGIAVGALASALGPMALDMIEGADASKELAASLKTLDATISRLQSAQGKLTSGDLTKEYGLMRGEAQQLLDVERRIAALRADEAMKTAQRGVAEGFGLGGVFATSSRDLANYVVAVRSLQEERDRLNASTHKLSDAEFAAALKRQEAIDQELDTLQSISSSLGDLQEMLGITEAEASQVAVRFAEIGEADGPKAQAEAMIALVEYISQVSENLSDASDEGKDLYDNLLQAAFAALDLAAVDVASNIGAGADEAGRLKDELAAALALFNRVSLQSSKVYSGRGGDPRKVGSDDYTSELGYEPVDEIIDRYTSKERNRSGAKQDQELNRLLRERDRILKSLETASDRYAKEVADLNKLYEMGELSAEQYNAAMGKLNEQLVDSEMGNLVRGIEDVSQALADATVEGEHFGDVLKNIVQRMLSEGIASNLRSIIGGVTGGGGILGTLLGAILPGNATGTNNWRGGLTRVNEHGGEIMNLPRGTQIIPHDISRRIADRSGGKGSAARVEVVGGDLTLSDNGQIMAKVNVRVQQGAAQAVQTVKTSLDGWQNQLGTDGALV